MSNKKKRWVIIIVSFVLVAIVSFVIYWNATEFDRTREHYMEIVEAAIEDERNGSFGYISHIDDEVIADAQFQDFLASKVEELYENNEIDVLRGYLYSLQCCECYSEKVLNAVIKCFNSSTSIEKALEMKDALDDSIFEYYKLRESINRDSPLIISYIENNGTKTISYTPGEGYYADCEDTSSKHTVGLPTSPLYDAESITHFGDFKHIHNYGRELNSYYEETSYSRNNYYFRGEYISFSPDDGECIWSSNYLFCFSDSGELIGFEEIEG